MTDVLGNGSADPTDSSNLGFYSINVNTGDPLQLSLNAIPAGRITELLLYDSSDDLVAIASGNAQDGRGSIIDFTIPSGLAGNWFAQVVV
jgi:hypothetical protein